MFCFGLAAALSAVAATNTWTGGGADDLWSTVGNWDAGAPSESSIVLFTAADAGTGWTQGAGTPNNVLTACRT